MNPSNSSPFRLTRRTFLKSSALATAAFSLPRFSIGQPGPSANGRVNVACIGIGNRGYFAVSELMKDPRVNLVAFADVDQVLVNETCSKSAELKKTAQLNCAQLNNVPVFRDYGEMFAKMGRQNDAVTVSTRIIIIPRGDDGGSTRKPVYRKNL